MCHVRGEMKHQFFRLAFAQYLDGTDGKCSICNHRYVDIDDAMDRQVVCMSQNPPKVACLKCTTRLGGDNVTADDI